MTSLILNLQTKGRRVVSFKRRQF